MSRTDTHGAELSNAFSQFYRWVFGIGYERNIGGRERAIRYTAGAVCSVVGLGLLIAPMLESMLLNGVLALVLLVCGVYVIYEAQVQYCPFNHTFDRSTYDG